MNARAAAVGVTLGGLRRRGWDLLKAAGVDNAVRETDWLLAFALDLPPHALVLDGERPVSARQAEQALALLTRRAAREPLQYLLGTQEFRGLDIVVTPDVLIPRLETELLVEATRQAVTALAGPAILDVGTGSGCVAVAIACELPEATVYALDISAPALAVARRNAARHGVRDRIRFVQADMLETLAAGTGGIFDVIVSNPPYVPAGDLDGLQPEVSRCEPRVALAGGGDGLAFHRRLLWETPPLLKAGGCVIMELGCGQAEAVTRLAHRSGSFDAVECRNDAAGIARVLVARKMAA